MKTLILSLLLFTASLHGASIGFVAALQGGVAAAGGGGGVTFDPATNMPSTGMFFFLSADQISGKNDGDAIGSSWVDLSGNGYNFTMPDSGRQPKYYTNGPNGHPYLKFDGVDDAVTNLNLVADGVTTWHGFTLFRITPATDLFDFVIHWRGPLTDGEQTTNSFGVYPHSNRQYVWAALDSGLDDISYVADATVAPDYTNWFVFEFQIAAASQIGYTNMVQTSSYTRTSTAGNIRSAFVGMNWFNVTEALITPMDLEVHTILIYTNLNLSASSRNTVSNQFRKVVTRIP
jgi:hypothetical protein